MRIHEKCQSLQFFYGNDSVDLKGTADYDSFTGGYWSEIQAEVDPYCIFYPSSPSEVSALVLLSRVTQCPFAVKSGGHAAFQNASNIEGGITVAFKNLNSIELSSDRKTAFIQPGNTWSQIYTELEKYDVAAIGGRVSPIGIGGLTTGGGVSFFSNIYGFACDNVASYEVVTSTGQIVTATPSQNSELYWALRGGGNNFGIVVKFELETIPLPGGEMWGGTRAYMEDQFPGVINAFHDLIEDSPSDPNAGTWAAWLNNAGMKLASAELYYAKPDGRNASIFNNFNALTAISDTTQNKNLVQYTAEVAQSNPYGLREGYYVLSVKASHAVLEAATEIFFEGTEAVADVTGAQPVMVWQAVTKGESHTFRPVLHI